MSEATPDVLRNMLSLRAGPTSENDRQTFKLLLDYVSQLETKGNSNTVVSLSSFKHACTPTFRVQPVSCILHWSRENTTIYNREVYD